MSSVVISGDTSGTITVAAPAVAGSNTLTLQAATATNSVNTLATAVASTSGTSIDFSSIPSWVKRITVMFSAVSTNGSASLRVQIGTGGTATTSGYVSISMNIQTAGNSVLTSTAGFDIFMNVASYSSSGAIRIQNITGNTWVAEGALGNTTTTNVLSPVAGTVTLGGVLNFLRFTTTNGTDAFDAGTVNILYEG